jgi:uncharacterized protein with NRDE domain
MCILFLAINQHPTYPLIVAANRDEYHNRPSSSIHFWEDQPDILAGRDELKGGTWLGVNRFGRFCAVTNFRSGEGIDTDALSRGELVSKFLENNLSEDEFTDFLVQKGSRYGPFNLIYGDKNKLHLYCNQNNSHTLITNGFHSISNGYIDQLWPKMSLGVEKLSRAVESATEIEFETLNEIMHDTTQAQDHELPETGVSYDVEKFISSIFIKGETYGTRTTTYALFTENEIHLHELNYRSSGEVKEQNDFRLEIQS